MESKKPKELWYLGENHTVDMVVFNESADKILVIQRGGEPFLDCWALPGGFVNTKAKRGEPFELDSETPKNAALRELREETVIKQAQLQMATLRQVGFFDDPHRDPRNCAQAKAVSWGFMVLAKGEPKPEPKDDAKNVAWVSIEDIEKKAIVLAFDHHKIVERALQMQRSLQIKSGWLESKQALELPVQRERKKVPGV